MSENTAQNPSAAKRYSSIDGIRAFAAVGIVMMHVKANGNYDITNGVISNVIAFFTCFVFLFMIISSFSMCCGYYDKMKEHTISLDDFYLRRYKKIWPFFGLLVLLDLVMGFSWHALAEGFADLTLVFSFLPNPSIQVIGVGWTLGVIFVFYVIFPFFVFLMGSKKRAWLTLVLALIYNVICTIYFFDDSHVTETFSARGNIVFCFMFFAAGGLIYLYREQIQNFVGRFKIPVLVLCWLMAIGYTFLGKLLAGNFAEIIKNFAMLLMFSVWLMYAISTEGKILNNRVFKFISSVSMEIYLCHMIIFRGLEKTKVLSLFGSGAVGYVLSVIVVLGGAVCFSIIVSEGLKIVGKKFSKIKVK